jgi:TP53 regulating kinase-like protein
LAELTLIKKGAEAELYRGDWLGFDAIYKRRVPKTYRNKEMDRLIRSSRTSLEAKLLSESRRLRVPTPVVFMADTERTEIIMSCIRGPPLKGVISGLDPKALKATFREVGVLVARLHRGGIVHGDLTTSNMIIKDGRVFLIDFGLGDHDSSLEARGVDIHLMRRTLESSHHLVAKDAYSSFIHGYSEEFGPGAKDVIGRVGEIRRRGRYVEGKRCAIE